jgi:hypothetical protein
MFGDSKDLLSFEEVCSLFDWDPGYIRKLIIKMTKEDLQKLDPTRFAEAVDCFGERMLWLSVMQRAIRDYVLYKGSGSFRIKWQQAYKYLFDKSPPPSNSRYNAWDEFGASVPFLKPYAVVTKRSIAFPAPVMQSAFA